MSDAKQKLEPKLQVFLKRLAERPHVVLACKAAGVSKTAVYELRKRDPEFAAAWDEARELAVETLETEAWDRTAVSDTMLIFLLKAERPDKYRETTRLELSIIRASNDTLVDIITRGGAELAQGEAPGSGGIDAPGRGPGEPVPAAIGDEE